MCFSRLELVGVNKSFDLLDVTVKNYRFELEWPLFCVRSSYFVSLTL